MVSTVLKSGAVWQVDSSPGCRCNTLLFDPAGRRSHPDKMDLPGSIPGSSTVRVSYSGLLYLASNQVTPVRSRLLAPALVVQRQDATLPTWKPQFDSGSMHIYSVSSAVELRCYIPRVVGSNPSQSTFTPIAQWTERRPSKPGVGSSNLSEGTISP